MRIIAFTLIALLVSPAFSANAEIVSAEKIWSEGNHNAFTDLLRWHDTWWCTFRESEAHVGGDGKIRIIKSTDGQKWESSALIAEKDIDLRDPKFSVTPDDRLMIVAGGSVYLGTKQLKGRQPRVMFSKDGKEWSAPQKVLEPGDWLWRVTWHDGVAYGTTYKNFDVDPAKPLKDWSLRLVKSKDGVAWEPLATWDIPGHPNETTVRFLKSGEAMAMVRREAGDKKGWIGTAKAPYKEWNWKPATYQFGGPNFIELSDGRLIAVTRDYTKKVSTLVAEMSADGTVTPLVTLPSGGDCSYAGMVWHEGLLWVSYYSSHEGKTNIYLAKVKLSEAPQRKAAMERIRISDDKRSFILADSHKPFVPWGFNYGNAGRLMEDFWDKDWKTLADDFAEIKAMGGNVVRVHLQFNKFMESADKPNAANLARLTKLTELAEQTGIYLDLTGLACYRKKDVPAWYDELDESARWAAQTKFWEAIADTCKNSRAIFCYDLINEPLSPGGKREKGAWYSGKTLGEYDFLQFIALDQKDRPRDQIAKAWIHQLATAIRAKDQSHMITVGLLPTIPKWGHFSGFVPATIAPELDYISVHIYPEKGKLAEAIDTLKQFAVPGKPLVIEETFPLHCSPDELKEFLLQSRSLACGWVTHYDGFTLDEYAALQKEGKLTLAQAIWRDALKLLQDVRPEMTAPPATQPAR